VTFQNFAKKQYHWFLCTLGYAVLIFSLFLRGQHRVHDSYLIEILGYESMFQDLFNQGFSLFYQGRVLSGWFYQILAQINPPPTLVLSLSVIASVLFLSLAVFFTLYMCYKYTNLGEKGIFAQVLAFLGTIALFFNLFTLEIFLFFENAVMTFSILCAVLAALFFLKSGWRNYIITLLLLLLSIFSYQAGIAYFLPLVVLFEGAKSGYAIKDTARKTLIAGLIYGLAMAANYTYILLVGPVDARFAGDADFLGNIMGMIAALISVISHNLRFFPRFGHFAFLAVFAILLITLNVKKPKRLLIQAISLIALSVAALIPHLPMGSFYVVPRSAVALGGLGGLMLILIALSAEQSKKLLLIPGILFLLVTSVIHIDAQQNNLTNNHLDHAEIHAIAQRIWEHEAAGGEEITVLHTIRGRPTSFYRPYLRSYGDLTIRVLSVDWMIRHMLQHHMHRSWDPSWAISYDDYLAHPLLETEVRSGTSRLLFDGNVLYLVIY